MLVPPLPHPSPGLSGKEVLVLLALSLVELLCPLLLGTELYDTRVALTQGVLALAEIGTGLGAYWLLLRLSGVPLGFRLPGAVWALAIWFGLFLSHISYLGYLLIPVEVLLAAVAIHRRVDLRWRRSFLVAAAGRGAILAMSALLRHFW